MIRALAKMKGEIQEAELEGTEIKMLSLSLGVTKTDSIKNMDNRRKAHVQCLGDKERGWDGLGQWRDSEYIEHEHALVSGHSRRHH